MCAGSICMHANLQPENSHLLPPPTRSIEENPTRLMSRLAICFVLCLHYRTLISSISINPQLSSNDRSFHLSQPGGSERPCVDFGRRKKGVLIRFNLAVNSTMSQQKGPVFFLAKHSEPPGINAHLHYQLGSCMNIDAF